MELKTLEKKNIKSAIKEILDSRNWSVTSILIKGDILFGTLHYLPQFFSGTIEEAENAGIWIPEESRSFSLEWRSGYKLLPLSLVFNSKEGEINGEAYIINIKENLISGIRPLFWTEESLSSVSLKNIPNPLATIIYNHNLKIAKKYNLNVAMIVEKALTEKGIPSKGIEFNKNEMIYIDWDFFSRLSGGNLSVGAYGIHLSPKRSLYQIAYDKLANGVIEKLSQFLSRLIPAEKKIEECRVEGFLIVPEVETTTMEGEECELIICSEMKTFSSDSNFIPVLLKKKSISYPKEFLPYLKSKLIFYGEIKQVPIKIAGYDSYYVLMARAIGYISSD